MEDIKKEIADLRSEIKSLTKIVRKIRSKLEDPDGEKQKARAINNGFNRKQNISDELRAFMGLGAGEQASRSEVTKFLTKYITDKGLKHPENGRQLVLDDTLRALLKPPADVQVTYLNLQKFLSPHYIKVEA
jgi:chromatin remodeling complex protein RSC6